MSEVHDRAHSHVQDNVQMIAIVGQLHQEAIHAQQEGHLGSTILRGCHDEGVIGRHRHGIDVLVMRRHSSCHQHLGRFAVI